MLLSNKRGTFFFARTYVLVEKARSALKRARDGAIMLISVLMLRLVFLDGTCRITAKSDQRRKLEGNEMLEYCEWLGTLKKAPVGVGDLNFICTNILFFRAIMPRSDQIIARLFVRDPCRQHVLLPGKE